MARPRVTRRWPLDPLFEAMGETPNAACQRLGVAGKTQQEYRRDGVSEVVADRLATKAGLHAYEVWPEMRDAVLEAELEERRRKNREKVRKYRQKPEVRARDAERARAYRAGMSPAAKAQTKAKNAAANERYRQSEKAKATRAQWFREKYQNDPDFRAQEHARQAEARTRRREAS